jgi:opacity protein-like surface antigen
MVISLARFGRPVFLFAVTGLSLLADSPRLGLAVLGAAPTGSMRSQYTHTTGYGLGAFADWEAGFGVNIRLAYDGLFYPGATDGYLLPGMAPGAVSSISNNRKYRSNTLSLQYIYFPDARNEGLYFLAGLGATNQTEKITSTAILSNGSGMTFTPTQTTGTKLAAMAGVGYEFNHTWGVSARYSFITVNAHTIGAVVGGVSYRF